MCILSLESLKLAEKSEVMKEVKVTPGLRYAVTATKECKVTFTLNGKSYTPVDMLAAGQASFTAASLSVQVSDDDALVTCDFKGASSVGAGGGSLTPAQLEELKAAAESINETKDQLDNAAILTQNNAFSGVNTFNGMLAANGGMEIAGDFSWGGISAEAREGAMSASPWLFKLMQESVDSDDARENVWLISQGINPASKNAQSTQAFLDANQGWENRKHLLIYTPNISVVAENLTISASSAEEVTVLTSTRNNTENGYSQIPALRWTVCYTGATFRGFEGLTKAKLFTLLLPNATNCSAAYNLNNLGRNATECELRIVAPKLVGFQSGTVNTQNAFFARPYWTTLRLYAPLLKQSFCIGWYNENNSAYTRLATYSQLRQLVDQLPTRDASAADGQIAASISAEEYTAQKSDFDALVTTAAGKNWNLQYTTY